MRIFAVVIAISYATAVQAGPLDIRQIPADAQWVAHVDVDIMRGPEVIAKAFEAVSEHSPDLPERMQSLRDDFGLNLAEDLHAVTVYGKQFGKPTGVLVANVTVDREKLESQMKDATGYTTKKHGSHTLHSWTDENGPLTGVFYSSNILIFARTAAEASEAIDVLDGKSPNLAGKDSPLAVKSPDGAAFVARAIKITDADLPWKSPLFQQSESIAASMTVDDKAVDCEISLTAKSPENIPLFEQAVQGGIAMATLQFGPDQGLTELFKKVKITVNGKTVNISWKAPVADVWTQAEKAFEKWE